jgi:predicted transcriptional regulator
VQLKKIRSALGITQMKLAEMLGVSYPYLLSVETGQRDMSAQLARKISWLGECHRTDFEIRMRRRWLGTRR